MNWYIEKMDYKQICAIQQANKNRIKNFCPDAIDESGIYIFTRVDENGIKYAYVGQAKKVLTRLAQHLSGYQHIDLSLKKHGFFDRLENKTGYTITCFYCPVEELDTKEQQFILATAKSGYQLRNKTAGGQGQGKYEIAETKPRKNYHDGLEQGYKNAQKQIIAIFDKSLDFVIKGKETATKLKAKAKFEKFIKGDSDDAV